MVEVKGHGRPTSPGPPHPRTDDVILVTRINGAVFALNQDLIERADCTPDTVVTLVDGTKYVISESLPELIALVRDFRPPVLPEAQRMETIPPRTLHPVDSDADVVPFHRREP